MTTASAVGAANFVPARVLEIETKLGVRSTTASSPMSTTDFQALLATAQSQLGSLMPSAKPSSVSSASLAGRTSASWGQSIVDNAKQYLGVPYLWGGTDPSKGLDCSGLVQLVFKNLGVDLPRTADIQALQGTAVPSLDQAQPGDLVAFGDPVEHIGIYAGNNQMVVAPHTGDVVKVQTVYQTPTAIRRISPPAGYASSSAATTFAGLLSGTSASGAVASASGAVASASGAVGSSSTGSGSLPAGTPYADLFKAAGARYGVDPALVAAVAKVESNFNPSAVSPAGAQGLMQFMPSTAAGIGIDPLVPEQAINGGAHYLATQMQRFGSVELALAAYNAGPGAVEQWGGVPPYAETQAYVQKVLNVMRGGA